MNLQIVEQRKVPTDVWLSYQATWKVLATFKRSSVFLGVSTDPLVVLTPLDEHTYQLTTLSYDTDEFQDLWEMDRRNKASEIRTYLEKEGLIR